MLFNVNTCIVYIILFFFFFDVYCYCFKIHIRIKKHVYMSLINSLSGKNIIYLKKGFLLVWLSFKVCDCTVIFFSTRYIQTCSWKTRTNKSDNLWKFVITCTSMNMSCFVKKSLKIKNKCLFFLSSHIIYDFL